MNFSKLVLMLALAVSVNNVICGMQQPDEHGEKPKREDDQSAEQQKKIKKDDDKPKYLQALSEALLEAVSKRNCQLSYVEQLLKINTEGFCADPNNIQGKMQFTPLYWAVWWGNAEIIKVLLEHGAHPNLQDHIIGMTSLHLAALQGNKLIVTLLLEHGADVTIKTTSCQTPLHFAVGADSEETVMLLLKHMKAFGNKRGHELMKRFLSNKEFEQHVWTYLLCLKRKNLKIPKFLTFKIMAIVGFFSFLKQWINAPNNKGKTAWDLGNAKIKKMIEEF